MLLTAGIIIITCFKCLSQNNKIVIPNVDANLFVDAFKSQGDVSFYKRLENGADIKRHKAGTYMVLKHDGTIVRLDPIPKDQQYVLALNAPCLSLCGEKSPLYNLSIDPNNTIK